MRKLKRYLLREFKGTITFSLGRKDTLPKNDEQGEDLEKGKKDARMVLVAVARDDMEREKERP